MNANVNKAVLSRILDKHQMWLNGNEKGKRADLSSCSLRGFDLWGVNLRGACLCHTDFSFSDLHNAHLEETSARDANFTKANLRGAGLSGADFSEVEFIDADLRDTTAYSTNFYRSSLRNADLQDSDLRRSNFYLADLTKANLVRANLNRANLYMARLHNADLQWVRNADLVFASTIILPEGDIIGWKILAQGRICKLRIPADARRSNAAGRKCRAERAEVLEIWDGKVQVSCGKSETHPDFIYRVGETVSAENFDVDRWNECSEGIHFFITRIEAEEYWS